MDTVVSTRRGWLTSEGIAVRIGDESFTEDQLKTQLAVDIAVLQQLGSDLHGSVETDDARYARTNSDLLLLLREGLDRWLEGAQQAELQFAAVFHQLSSSLQRADRVRNIETDADDVPAGVSRSGALTIRLPRRLPGLVLADTGPAPALTTEWLPREGTVQLLQGTPVGALRYMRERDAATLDVTVWWSMQAASLLARAGQASPLRSVAAPDRRLLERDARMRVTTMWSAFADVGVQVASGTEASRAVMNHADLHGVEFR